VKRPPRAAASTGGRGFTLVEVAVVICMIGVLAAVAALFLNPRTTAETSRGYAQEVAALCETMRQRAVATRTWQRLVVQADRVIHQRADDPGMAQPDDVDGYDDGHVGMVAVPPQVVIAAVSFRTHVNVDDSVPAPGTNVPAFIYFRPDGTALEPATIFVSDSRSEQRARVAIYPATGSAYAYQDW
jgi:prepilin-type N-terminal cleavage/methylation domain-containing protein